MTKPIIVVKIFYKLLYVIQVINIFLISTYVTSWPQLISKFLVVHTVPTRGNVTYVCTLHAGATTPTRVPAIEIGVSHV